MGTIKTLRPKNYIGLDADKSSVTGGYGDTYFATDTGFLYRWSGTAWIRETPTDILSDTRSGDFSLGVSAYYDIPDLSISFTVPTGKTWKVWAGLSFTGYHLEGAARIIEIRITDSITNGIAMDSTWANGTWYSMSNQYVKTFTPGSYTIKGQIWASADNVDIFSGTSQLTLIISEVS